MPAPETSRSPGRFVTTQWSLIVAAGGAESGPTREALSALCEAYWQPIYVYLRRHGHEREPALDLTQGFFTRLLEKNDVAAADRERGRFRTFLLTALIHFVANERDRERALKRGGGRPLLSLDAGDAEQAWLAEPSHTETPERLFDRRWARSMLEAAVIRLRDEQRDPRTGDRFDRLLPLASGIGEDGYAEAAAALGVGPSAVRVAVHRLRRRLRILLREEVERTVGDPALVDDELRHLLTVLSS